MVSAIKEKFENWKFKYPTEYNQLYCTKNIPLLFQPFVKLELLNWDILGMEDLFLNQTNWWNSLISYGFREDIELDKSDRDRNIVPQIIAKTVLERVKIVFSHVWNPISTSQTKKAISILAELNDYDSIKKVREGIQKMNITITVAIEDTINNFTILSVPKRDNMDPDIKEYLESSLWRGIKLFRNILLWSGYVPDSAIKSLVFQNLLNMKVIPYLKTLSFAESLVPVENIMITISKSKLLESKEGVLTELYILIGYLMNLATKFDSKQNDKSLIQKIIQYLYDLNAKKEAEEIKNKFL